MRIAGGSSLGNTAISVSSGATLAALPTTSASVSADGTLTIPAGAAFTMNDGAIGTFHLTNTGTALTLGSDSGAAPTLGFDINGFAASDAISVAGAASVLTTGDQIDITPIDSSLANGTYPLITATGGLDGGGGFFFAGNVQTMPLTLGATTYTLTLQNSGTAEQLVVTGGTAAPAVAYWKGSLSGAGAGVWNAVGAGNSTNWATDAGGATDTLEIPGAVTDVVFSVTGGGANLNTTLGADTAIKGLTFTADADASHQVTIGGSNVLLIGSDGLTVAAGSGSIRSARRASCSTRPKPGPTTRPAI